MSKRNIEELLETLTIDEKIGQLVQLDVNFFNYDCDLKTGTPRDIGIKEDVIKYTGSILNFYGAKGLKQIQDEYLKQSNKKIPLLFMADIINGFKTAFPIPLGQGATFNPRLIEESANVAAREAAVSGLHVTFSPMVDLVRDARWGRVMESNGEDSYLNSLYAKAIVQGYRQDLNPYKTIASCVKHFAGYGAPTAGREYNTVELSNRTLREMYLPSYKAAVDAGCDLVMTSFNTIDGIPVTGNEVLMKNILREEWGFEGVTISDHSAIRELIDHGVASDGKEAAKLSIDAMVDIDMMTSVYSNNLKVLLDENKISESQIDNAVRRVLQLKEKLGLFENPYRGADEELEKEYILCDEHLKIARKVVNESCVLLKNENVLPISKDKKIALIGPYANNSSLSGMWAFSSDDKDVVTVKNGFLNKVSEDNLTVTQGCKMLDDNGVFEAFGRVYEDKDNTLEREECMLEDVRKVVLDCDVVVLALGEHILQSGEGGSRGNLKISQSQINLLKYVKTFNKPTVVLLFNGRPLALNEVLENCDSLLECWFPGTEGGNGIADIVFGDTNPSGRLTMSFPYDVGQCPISYNEFNTGRPENSGMRRFTSVYLDMPNEPLFEFGYGLSYTEFRYSNISIDKETMSDYDKIIASVEVENVGSVPGYETVQLYIQDLIGSVVRPKKELKGFEKVYLFPGETKKIEFEINESMLRFYNKDMNFVSEAGEFKIYIGNSSKCSENIVFTLEK